jgi:hypothetical protein
VADTELASRGRFRDIGEIRMTDGGVGAVRVQSRGTKFVIKHVGVCGFGFWIERPGFEYETRSVGQMLGGRNSVA